MHSAIKESRHIPVKTSLPFLCVVFIFFLLISPLAYAATAPKRWAVNLTSYLVSDDADNAARDLKAAGYNAYVTDVTVKGKLYFRLRIGFFATKKEAEAQAQQISAKFKEEDAWSVKVSEAEAERYAAAATKGEKIKPEQPQATVLPKAAVTPQEPIKSQTVPAPKPVTAAPHTTTEVEPVRPDANGVIHVNIYKDFKYVSSGWPMGLSVGQTDAAGLTTVPYEVFKRERAYTSAKPLYGYFSIGNSNDKKVSFVLDKVEKTEWELYVDKNNNEDLTDDGPAIKNNGSSKMAAVVTLEADLTMSDGTARKTPYQLWFFINTSGPHFYATCHYAGKIYIGTDIYDAVAFEELNHDALFKESGICVDIDRDAKCSHEREVFKDGATATIKGGKYTFRLDYP